MAILVLPADSERPHYDFDVDLEGRSYTVEVRWNQRASSWFLTLRNAAGEILAAGRRLVLGTNLLGRSPDERLPPGGLVAVDTSGREIDPGRDDLGSRVLLCYYEA